MRPSSPDDDEYHIIFRFDHASNLRRWEDSEERRRRLREVRPLIQREDVRVLTGLETWFTLPSKLVMVALMTYVIIPRMTRLFSFWLYPDRDE